MLWKNLIAAIARYAEAHPDDAGVQTLKMAAKGAGKPDLQAYLDTADVRNVGNLKRLAPMAFPRHLRRSGDLTARLNPHGEWTVFSAQPMDASTHRRRYLR